MHEMSIAMQLVDQVLEVARQNRAVRVEEVEVGIGRMQMVVPEALETAFSMATEGTLLEGARLRIVNQEIEAVCQDCQRGYRPSLRAIYARRAGGLMPGLCRAMRLY